ncbi:FAD-dependent monooxygenase [Streptomyces sp. NPDC006372]|uniref:FAD-dependent monooxygenase n=1 Tax=Streptomyces sp. NPDC006372 TaxID=3155599 RepID=UPI00339FA2FE
MACIGAGPAGLFAAAEIKRTRPDHHVVVYERAPKHVTYGYGVVFSDVAARAIQYMAPHLDALLAEQTSWQDVEVRRRDRRYRIPGHGYRAVSRHRLLGQLARRAVDLGVELHYETPVDLDELSADLIIAADGAHSKTRQMFAAGLGARTTYGRSRFLWLGTRARFDAMTFIIEQSGDTVVIGHGYPHGDDLSTFVVEIAGTGPTPCAQEVDLAHWSSVFEEHLQGHVLEANGEPRWAHFPEVRLDRFVHGNVVVIGDAAHTVHYSVGSGTRLALEDGFYLARSLAQHTEMGDALDAYQRRRLRAVGDLQSAGARSMRWFENIPAYAEKPPAQFTMALLGRTAHPDVRELELTAQPLVQHALKEFTADADDEGGGVFGLPLFIRNVKIRNRRAISLTPDSRRVDDGTEFGLVISTDRAKPKPSAYPGAVRAILLDVGALNDVRDWDAVDAPELVVLDGGPHPAEPVEDHAARLLAQLGAADLGGRPVAVRTRLASTGEPPARGATKPLLTWLGALRTAGYCDMVDLAASGEGGTSHDQLLTALETAELIGSVLGVPMMLSGFTAPPERTEPHMLGRRLDLWCEG